MAMAESASREYSMAHTSVGRGLDYGINTLVTKDERIAFARRALSLNRGIAAHVRALILQDLASAAAGLPPPPAAPGTQYRTAPRLVGRTRTASFIDRFWGHVGKREEEACWEWQAARTRANYGSIDGRKDGYGTQAAHRIAWMIANDAEIPTGMVIMHLCDNPPCCNPRHLRLGTVAENAADKAWKDRGAKRTVSLSYEQSMVYRERLLKGELTMSDISRETSVGKSTISRLLRGQTLTADFKRLPSVQLPRRHRASAIERALTTILLEGGVTLVELCDRVKKLCPGRERSARAALYRMWAEGKVVYTGKRRKTVCYLPGTVPDGVPIRPYVRNADALSLTTTAMDDGAA